MRARRIAAAGLVLAVAYLAAAWGTFALTGMPERPLFDGFHGTGAPPYGWVNPPPQESPNNFPPQPGEGQMPFKGKGSDDFTLSTRDATPQATIIFPRGAIQRKGGVQSVLVTIEPLDPGALAPVPDGMEFESNAYRFEATYVPTGDPAAIRASENCEPLGSRVPCPTVVLMTKYGATLMYRLEGGAWVETVPKAVEASGGIFGDSPTLGTFVAVNKEGTIAARSGVVQSSRTGDLIAIGLAILAMVGAGVLYRRRAGQKREEVRRKAAGVKYRPQKGAKAPPQN